jgi:hypothetical protein
MPAGSNSLSSLEAAYRSSLFEVTGTSPPFTLHVEEHCAPLAALHRLHGVATSAYLTAVNPRSVVQPDAENSRREAELEQWLRAEGHVWFAGHSVDPRGVWPNEPCVLILGIRHEDAWRIGKHFDQNAIVWCPPTAVPELVMLVCAADLVAG